MESRLKSPKIAVLLPCFNEGPAIDGVVRAFRSVLPDSEVYVYDNMSADDTAAKARDAGAIVRIEPRRGKGNVVRTMFADIEADVYVMADGDGTYDALDAPKMIELLVRDNLDMVVGIRSKSAGAQLFRPGHKFGNKILTKTVAHLFENRFHDILSGYRVMSRRFVKSFPPLASGFEIETLLTVHALELRLPIAETGCRYFERIEGTASKLKTSRDGIRILGTILYLLKEVRPFLFFGMLAALFVATSLGLGLPIVIEFIKTGLVPRFPTAILATGLMILGGIALTCGLILDSVCRGRLENKRLYYQSLASTQTLLAQQYASPQEVGSEKRDGSASR